MPRDFSKKPRSPGRDDGLAHYLAVFDDCDDEEYPGAGQLRAERIESQPDDVNAAVSEFRVLMNYQDPGTIGVLFRVEAVATARIGTKVNFRKNENDLQL